MIELSARERLQPSLLDRLTDDAPQDKHEASSEQTLTMRQLRQAVLRDLAWLLNTSNLATTSDLTDFPLAARSAVNFGIPGFAGLARGNSKISKLEQSIADAITAFEPRIRSGTLVVQSRRANNDSAAAVFEVSGELWAQPAPVQLFLETAIDLETRLAVVADVGARD